MIRCSLVISTIAVTILFTVTVVLNFTSYASEDQFIYSVDSSPYNKTFQDWMEKWWQWYVSVPKTHSPNYPGYPNHITTNDCSVLQDPSNPVFYLFTPLTDMGKVEWTCTIPKGKSIFLPIVSASADFGDPTLPSKTDESLVSTAKPGNNNAQIKVMLDGKTLGFNSDPKWRTLTGFFNYTLPQHNLWDDKESPGTYRAVAEGYNLFLKPLTPGEHLLHYEAAVLPPNEAQYAQDVTYHLNVK